MQDPAMMLFLLGLLQIIIVGLGAWTLSATIRLQNRVTKIETLLEASILSDVKNLKDRVSLIELSCHKN